MRSFHDAEDMAVHSSFAQAKMKMKNFIGEKLEAALVLKIENKETSSQPKAIFSVAVMEARLAALEANTAHMQQQIDNLTRDNQDLKHECSKLYILCHLLEEFTPRFLHASWFRAKFKENCEALKFRNFFLKPN